MSKRGSSTGKNPQRTKFKDTRQFATVAVSIGAALAIGIFSINGCSSFNSATGTPKGDSPAAQSPVADQSNTAATNKREAPYAGKPAEQVEEYDAGGLAPAPRTNARTQHLALRTSNLRALGYVVEGRHLPPPPNGELYDTIEEEGFLSPLHNPLSTFSIDVDTASYSNVRRILKDGTLPPHGAVRIEELLNYFSYNYPKADSETPISVLSEIGSAPWAPENQLVMVGLKGVEIEDEALPPRNLTFLLDVSGSMQSPGKLDLVVRGMKGLVKTLRPEDHVAIAVYAGASGLVLPSTSGTDRNEILAALDRLRAGGSTNGGEGIRLAYKTARKNFDPAGINRVILASDGDFNVGTTDRNALVSLIEEERRSGVFLTILGVGSGNLKDATMEDLADRGNGNYAYLDTIGEARKVLIREGGGTLVTVAKDVKIQVEFNPAKIAGYRLIGYDNRRLADRDFNDDRKDAGELGAGHSVTALYEIVPHGVDGRRAAVDPLRYQVPEVREQASQASDELFTVKLRYKLPSEDESRLITRHLSMDDVELNQPSEDFRFAAAVATFGMLLRDSPYGGDANWDLASGLAKGALGSDPHGYRAEFLYLVREARQLTVGMGS